MLPGFKGQGLGEFWDGKGFLAAGDEDGSELGVGIGQMSELRDESAADTAGA